MSKKTSPVYFLCLSAVIAAAYAVLTMAAAALGWAYGPIQFRFSEALTVLPALTSAAVPGLSLGCFLANLGSPLGPVDWIFGTLATLAAAFGTRALRHIRFRGIPVLAPLPPILANAVIIGLEIACLGDTGFSVAGFSMAAFLPNALYVGLGELFVCYGLGIPLLVALSRIPVFKPLFQKDELRPLYK